MMLMLIQEGANEPQQIKITQETVIAILAASTIIVVAMLWLIGRFVSRTPADPGPLHYGNFFVVIFGLMTALIGFLIAFPLVVSNVFSDPTQVIALLSALFGTIVGLVGTYFGIKSSSDAARGAQDIAERATPGNTRLTNGSHGGLASGAATETPNGAASGTTTAAGSRTTTEVVPRTSPPADSEAPSQEDSDGNR